MSKLLNDYNFRPLLWTLKRKRFGAALTIFSETLIRASWRPVFWLVFFAALWLIKIPSFLGTAGEIGTALIFWSGFIYLLTDFFRTLRWPTQHEVHARLEEASDLSHRPLDSLHDKLSNPDKSKTQNLWTLSQQQAAEKIRLLKSPKRRPQIAGQDPYALRMLSVLLLFIGLGTGYGHYESLLKKGLMPIDAQKIVVKNLHTTIWVTPPEYTTLPNTVIENAEGYEDSLPVPEGSEIKVLVHGGFFTPRLIIGENETHLTKHDQKNWVLSVKSEDAAALQIKQLFFTRVNIATYFVEDRPPSVRLDGDHEVLEKGHLRIPVSMYDDYSVIDLKMRMSLAPIIEDAPLGQDVEEIRTVMSAPRTEAKLKNIYDLTWHSWAGLPAIITFEVIDHKGQTSQSEPLELTLPEREFAHPVAQQLVAIRKRLAWTPQDAAGNAAYDLESILIKPESFHNDPVVFLGLRSAASRLIVTQRDEDVTTVINLLWQLALKIEDGNLPLASSQLRAARKKLEDLLKDPNSTDEQIAEASEELRQAMAQYMQEMVRELQKQAQNGRMPVLPPDAAEKILSPNALAEFLDRMQAEALTGDRDAAQRMLSELGQFMDSINPSLSQEIPKEMQYMDNAVNELQELIQKQQELLDQTMEQAGLTGQDSEDEHMVEDPHYPDFLPFAVPPEIEWKQLLPPPPQERLEEEAARLPEKKAAEDALKAPSIDTTANKAEQEALRLVLGKLMTDAADVLGNIPEGMQKAEQEMRLSSKWLGENDPVQSVTHQELAIKYLKEAMDSMSEQLQEMMKQMNVVSFGNMPRDPLGRPMSQDGNNFSGAQIKIPDEAERKRVQDILEQLRKKSGELHRPDYELDYYRRLMKQF